MTFQVLETVVLTRDIPEESLKAGDLGAVVEVYGLDAMDVEFVTADGSTQALLTLKVADLRRVGPRDMVAVRTVKAA